MSRSGFVESGGRVVPVDPLDPEHDELFLAHHRVALATGEAEFGDRHTVPAAEEVRSRHATDTSVRMLAVAAVSGTGEVVGAASLRLPVLDNPHLAVGELLVHPRHRRQGVGTALLARLEALSVEAARTTLALEASRAADGVDVQGPFAQRHGYTRALTSLRSDLDLPGGAADLERGLAAVDAEVLGTQGRDGAARYRLLTWWDGIPDEWLDQVAVLNGRMSTDAPLGELALEPEAWDADRVRERTEVIRSRGRRFVTTVALDVATGTLAGFTDLGVALHSPSTAYQWNTLALREHRGARLGMRLKAANLRALLAELPAVRRVVTWNAEQNEPMLRVNRVIGFHVVGAFVEWQKHL